MARMKAEHWMLLICLLLFAAGIFCYVMAAVGP